MKVICVRGSLRVFMRTNGMQNSHCHIGEQGQIMLANQRVCLHFASLTNQNA